ncbi:large-conductance mechanosensitive channel protein MscL [Sinomicrobium kalidii]|uniref:large-conductance mechanosensitive channel protein MscL n=1 Tax=Sinomicrobium kalidii TaxID=2900738 RepID=UPI001E65D403|nr:large-conductance mechanosensitive channel protein MscL [Sinomicrobium kalidii]UGU14335.1 large-conductance mechanosensitive channel protein MscL [Sinomicrobium kalidii]
MGFFKDFKSFLLKGDIVNLATAVIIAGAFGKIVSSFTNDLLMPPIGLVLGNVNFADLKYELREAVTDASGEITRAAVSINYGNFIQLVIDFIIIGFCIFMVLKAYERTRKKEKPAPAAPAGPTQEELLAEIRDLLKK